MVRCICSISYSSPGAPLQGVQVSLRDSLSCRLHGHCPPSLSAVVSKRTGRCNLLEITATAGHQNYGNAVCTFLFSGLKFRNVSMLLSRTWRGFLYVQFGAAHLLAMTLSKIFLLYSHMVSLTGRKMSGKCPEHPWPTLLTYFPSGNFQENVRTSSA